MYVSFVCEWVYMRVYLTVCECVYVCVSVCGGSVGCWSFITH